MNFIRTNTHQGRNATGANAITPPMPVRRAVSPLGGDERRGGSPGNHAIHVDHLGAFGFQDGTVAAWQQAGLGALLPLQVQAITGTGLLRGGSLVVLAPTSAGKTFVGELAAMRHFELGKKAVFLCPTRALAAEQFAHLAARYAGCGVRVVLSTADCTRYDGALRRGDFDFAVMVYEKLRSVMVWQPEVLQSVGVVVADELQILGDAGRGDMADGLLTRLASPEWGMQIVGLSAVISEGQRLAEWLGAELLESGMRPVPLREGIYCMDEERFHYYCGESGSWQEESLPAQVTTGFGAARGGLCAEGPELSALVELTAGLARAGQSCLVFVPTRSLSREVSGRLARELGRQGDVDAGAWDDLQYAEDCLARRQLLECVPSGVAFHNSDLTADLRLMIESGFSQGRLRVIVATPTLAQGVNLKAQNVLHVPAMLLGTGRQALVPLAVQRYRNQAGRAGRLGGGADFGRSILIGRTRADAERLARQYIGTAPEAMTPRFTRQNLEHFLLDAVHGGQADNFTSAVSALHLTFAAHAGALTAAASLDDNLAECLGELLRLNLLEESAGNRLKLTGTGQAMAAGGYSSATMRELVHNLWQWGERRPGTMEILCACAFTADGEQYPVSASSAEMKGNVWRRQAREILLKEGAPLDSEPAFHWLEPPGGLSQAGHSCLKKAVIAHGWLSGADTADLEERHRTIAGTMAGLAAHLAWVAGGLAACAGQLQCSDDTLAVIEQVAARLPMGLVPEAADLADLQGPGLSRQVLNRLALAGFGTAKEIAAAPDDALAGLIPTRLLEPLRTACRAMSGNRTYTESPIPGFLAEESPAVDSAQSAAVSSADNFVLRIHRDDPAYVEYHGRRIRLTPKPYALLRLLAERAGRVVPYRSIDEIVWPDVKVEPQQVSAARGRVLRALEKVSGTDASSIIETEPRVGLRLNLAPDQVDLDGTARPG